MRSWHASLVGRLGMMALAVVLPSLPAASEGTACYPALDSDQAHYMIGYGSLMQTASKDRSWRDTGTSLPVRVRGFERSWSVRSTDIGFGATVLGARPRAGAEMVAALFRIYETKDFEPGDARERSYCRARVPPSAIQMLDGSAVPDLGSIWIYVGEPENLAPADARFPIIQSYVDVFLSGCIELARRRVAEDLDFLAACIITTQGWSVHWVNDRIHPRRPVGQPHAARIDAILHRMLPVQFEAIQIE